MVNRPEETEAEIPGRVVAEDRVRRSGILGEAGGEATVDRRAEEREVLRLAAEDLRRRFGGAQAASASDSSAAFACSATAANAFGSETAMSASDLRSSSIPAL